MSVVCIEMCHKRKRFIEICLYISLRKRCIEICLDISLICKESDVFGAAHILHMRLEYGDMNDTVCTYIH